MRSFLFPLLMFTVLYAAAGGAMANEPAAAPVPAKQPTSFPSPREMAPLAVPSTFTPASDFPKRLEWMCNALTDPAWGVAPNATRFSAAPVLAAGTIAAAKSALAGLSQPCADIAAGTKLTADEIASLRELRDHAADIARHMAGLKAAHALQEGDVTTPSLSSGSLETQIIQGLANFIYDRAKQEAVMVLARQLSKTLCETQPNPLFFPLVCVAVKQTTAPVPLGAIGGYLVAAARGDIARLPDRALAYELHFRTRPEDAAAREVLFGARLGLAYYDTVATGRMPLDVARSLRAVQVPTGVVGADTQVRYAVVVASELVDAIAAQQGWEALTSAIDANARYYALGAAFSFADLHEADGNPLGAFDVNRIPEVIPALAQYLVDAIALLKRAREAKDAMTARAPSGSDGGGFGDGRGGGAGRGGDGANGGAPSELTARDYLIATTQTVQRALDGGVVIGLKLGLVSADLAKTVGSVSEVFQAGEQVVSGQSPAEMLIAAVGLVNRIGDATAAFRSSPLPEEIVDAEQLMALVAQVAQAKSADEVAKVLEAGAAPASTYEVKYQHSMVTLGALVGVSAGGEWVRVAPSDWSIGGAAGAFAPVGVTASTPFGCGWFHAGAMLSAINLGALVSSRFSNDVHTTGAMTTTTVQSSIQTKLANVFAPGFFLAVGIARLPLVVSFGGQVIPEGRELSTVGPDGSTHTSTTPAVQVVGALSIDVPMFSF